MKIVRAYDSNIERNAITIKTVSIYLSRSSIVCNSRIHYTYQNSFLNKRLFNMAFEVFDSVCWTGKRYSHYNDKRTNRTNVTPLYGSSISMAIAQQKPHLPFISVFRSRVIQSPIAINIEIQ